LRLIRWSDQKNMSGLHFKYVCFVMVLYLEPYDSAAMFLDVQDS
jgi:hypothetical protein